MAHAVWFRRILFGLAIALTLASTRVLDALPVFVLIRSLYQGDDRQQTMVYVLSLLAVSLFSLLAMAVSWGLKQNWTWAFWGGRFCAVVLITGGFPWLAPFGMYGLYALRDRPERPAAPLEKRGNAVVTAVLRLSSGAALLHGWGLILQHADAWGLPPGWIGSWFWGVLCAAELVGISLHEFGHALMAKIVGFRLRAICIGPLTVSRESHGPSHVRWTWSGVLGNGGYVGATPVSGDHVRSNMIFVVLAGPVASLLSSLLALSATLALSGTALAPYWEFSACLSLICAIHGIWNLIPVGLNATPSDGSMLLSLLFWNAKGRQLVDNLMSGKLHEDSESLRMQGDTESEVRMLQRALAQAQDSGNPTPETLFMRRLQLGFAQLRSGDHAESEEHLLECLKLLEKMKDPNPSYAANIWMGLRGVYETTERPAEATRAYEAALAAFEDVLRRLPRAPEIGHIRAAIAGMHCSENHFQLGLDEIARALPYFPSQGLTRAGLLCHRAECEFNLGFPDRGVKTADEAETLIRAELQNEATARQAIAHLVVLANALEEGALTERSIALLQEAVERNTAAGLDERARSHRYLLSIRLRQQGRGLEAGAILPPVEEVPEKERAVYWMAQARVHLDAGRPREAAEDFEKAWRIRMETQASRTVLIGSAQSGLAEAYQVCGCAEEARSHAQAALEVLHAAGHADASNPILTLALLDWPAPELVNRAMEIIAKSQDLRPIQKAHSFDALADRLEKAHLAEHAGRAREAARELRDFLKGMLAPALETVPL